MKQSLLLLALTLASVTNTSAAQQRTGAEIFAGNILQSGYELSIGDDTCNLKIFHRPKIDGNGDVVKNEGLLETQLWAYGHIIDIDVAALPQKLKISDSDKVVLKGFGRKIIIEADASDNPVKASGKSIFNRTGYTGNPVKGSDKTIDCDFTQN